MEWNACFESTIFFNKKDYIVLDLSKLHDLKSLRESTICASS